MEQNQPTATQTIQPSSPALPAGRHSNFLTIFLSLLLAISLGATGFFFYQVQNLKKQLSELELESVSNELSTPIPTTNNPQPIATSDPTAGWKVFTNDKFTFKHPSEWTVSEGSEEYWGGKAAVVNNPEKSVTITIYPAINNRFPYGFGGDVVVEKSIIKLSFLGKDYELQENKRDQKTLYVELVDDGKYSFMFGTGYPSGSDSLASLSDYYRDREKIIQILSSFKFTQ